MTLANPAGKADNSSSELSPELRAAYEKAARELQAYLDEKYPNGRPQPRKSVGRRVLDFLGFA